MPNQTQSTDARVRAEARFKRSEQMKGDASPALSQLEAERIATTEKTARLRALRLAKKEADLIQGVLDTKLRLSTHRAGVRRVSK